MRSRVFVFVLLVIITLTGGYLVGCATGGQPHMNAALDELRAARSELQSAEDNKGGHRARAIGLVDDAIAEVQAGIEFARTH
jgi:hypothetical protein